MEAQTRGRAISIDIDGTIANVSARLAYAQNKYPYGSGPFWGIFLSGRLLYMDQPIPGASDFLQRYSHCGQIIYLSGRSASTLDATRTWLLDHNFPEGQILLRPSGNTRQFKINQLSRLKNEYQLEAHIGDTEDDQIPAEIAGVPFVHVETDQWIDHDPVPVC